MSTPEYDPAYCIHCGTSTPIEQDHPCIMLFGVCYVLCRGCGKFVPYNA